MFDNLTDAVGFAMHEDRLARASRDRRLGEAERVRSGERAHHDFGRAVIARQWTRLANRLAPGAMAREIAPA